MIFIISCVSLPTINQKPMKQIFTLLIVALISINLNATNISVSGNISANTTWSADTVFVTGDLIVDSAIVLTINPGVIVIFENNYTVDVWGTVIAVGSPTEEIVFTADSTGFSTFSHIGWNGFIFDNYTDTIFGDTSKFVNCQFSYGYTNDGLITNRDYSKLIVDHCTFSKNYSDDKGAAICLSSAANIRVSRCVFTENYANYAGGALEVNCDGSDSLSEPTIEDCLFTNNHSMYSGSYYGGGAMKLSGETKARIINNKFLFNSCPDGSGGGAILVSGYASPVLINNLIANNTAVFNGGGIMVRYYTNPILINNTIINNVTDSMGGGIGIGCSSDSIIMQNNIIYGNTATLGPQVFINNDDSCKGFTFINNDFEGGTAAFGLGDTAIFAPTYSGNMDFDPEVANLTTFELSPCSQAIDAGSISGIMVPPVDFYHNPRIFGSAIDLGAVERQLPQSIVVNDTLQFCIGDSVEYDGVWYNTSDIVNDTLAGIQYCDSVFSMHILAIDCSSLNELSLQVSVYPNPSQGQVHFVSNSLTGSEWVTFYDLTGRNLYSINLTEENQLIVLPTEVYGVVFYTISNNDGFVATGRLIVE